MQLSIVYSYCMSSKGTEVIYFKPSHQHLVSFPDPTTHVRKGSGDIGADSWFCKLSNHVIFFFCIHVGLYWSTCGHVMVRKTKKTLQCPQTLSSWVGSEEVGRMVT